MNATNKKRSRRLGFTLVEIIVASSIMVLVTAGVMSFYLLLRKTWTKTVATMNVSMSAGRAVDKFVYGRGNDPHGLRAATGSSVWVWSNGTNWMINYNSNRWVFYDATAQTISSDANGVLCSGVIASTCTVSALGAGISFTIADGVGAYRATNLVQTYVEYRN